MADQRPMVCFAEPLGSSDHRAVPVFGFDEFDPLPMHSVEAVIHAVSTTPGLYGVMPIENSTEGELTLSIDRLIFESEMAYVVAEAVLGEPIWAFALSEKGEIGDVISHAMILDLAAGFIQQHGLRTHHAVSTAAACQRVASGSTPGMVALAPPAVGHSYGLVPIETEVMVVPEIRTRYALIGKEIPRPTGDDKTMLVIAPRADAVGALEEIAGFFAVHGVNMYSIVSRPLAQLPEFHCFVIGAEGHVSEAPLSGLVRALIEAAHGVKLLGSFPRWRRSEVVNPSLTLPKGMMHMIDLPG